MEALSQIVALDEDAWRLLLDEIPVGIAIAEPVQPDGTIRPDARINFFNKKWTEMFGFDAAEVKTVEQKTRRLYPEPDVHAQMLAMRGAAAGRIREGGRSGHTEIRAMGANSEWLDVITGTTVVGDRLVVTMLDITERKRAARELEEMQRSRENEAYEVTENIPAGTYTMVQPPEGGFGRFSFLSSRFLEIFGLKREAVDQDTLNVFALVHPEEHDEFLRKNIETFERKIPFSEEFRAIVRGETRWFHAASNPRPLPDGSTVWEGVLTDITERKQAENKLRDTLMNLPIPVAVGTNDEPPRIALVNRAFTESFGYTHEDISTVQRWIELAYPDPAYRAEVMSRWEKSLPADRNTTSANVATDVRIRCKDGSVRDAIFSTTLTPDGPIVAFQDITERKKAETRLATTNARMSLAARTAQLGFWHFHVAENREEWDDNLYAMYGHTPDDRRPRWENFLHPEDREAAARQLGAAMTKGGDYEIEFRILRPDGVVRHIRECGFVVHDENGRAISATGADIDITERQLAVQRQQETEQAHRAELERKLKTSLTAAAVAHEINQPLSAILLDSQMALDRMKGDSRELEQARAFLSSTISNAERTADTIGKMMSLLRSVQTKPQQVDLVNVLRSAELYAKDQIQAARINLRIEGAGRAVKIRGDEGQLLLALSNLLRNAIESIEARNRPAPGEILVSLRREKGSVVLAVGDSGAGLPAQTLARIPLNTTKPAGTGLGLFIVKSVAENHGATLEAGRSELGGAEIRLVFAAPEN